MKNVFKKIIPALVLLLLGGNAVLAGTYDVGQAAQTLAQGSPVSTPDKIFQILAKVTRYVYTIFFIVAVIFIILAAFSFLTAKGDPEKINSSRSQILWAVVAIAIALISVGAAQIILLFIKNP